MSDPLFMVKTAFYIGNYRQCVKEAQKLQLGDQSLDLECDILMYRAYLAEGKCSTLLISHSCKKYFVLLKCLMNIY